MFRYIFIGALSLGILWGGSLRAEIGTTFADGRKLVAWCNSTNKAEQNYCATYIAGVADVMAYSPVGSFRACLAKDRTTISQAVEAVKAWLEAHPKDYHFKAVSLVARALSESYSCESN